MANSIFSRIVAGELPAYKVAEDDHHLAFLDITPLVEGHTLVIPKREVDYIFDLPPAELAALHQFAQRVAVGVREAVPCKRVGVAVIGLEVPHAHIHLIPMKHVSDMNFANPKIKVEAARMQELAAAIGAKVAAPAPAPTSAPVSAPATTEADLAPLHSLTRGLRFISESEAALEPVAFAAPAEGLTEAWLCHLAGVPEGTPVEKLELTYFLRNHTADDGVTGSPELANRFKALQMYLKQEVNGTQVYRFGAGPQVPVLVLGGDHTGHLVGFKTVLTET